LPSSILLQISLRNIEKAKELIGEAMSRYRRHSARFTTSADQYTTVISTLALQVLAAEGQYNEASQTIESDEMYVEEEVVV
jgi:hypothetical protein